MITADVKFGRVKNRLPYFARVSLAVECASDSPELKFSCSGSGFTSQGYVEQVPATGYDDWKSGASAGILFALSVTRHTKCRMDIQGIEGRTTDTNPTVVGYAAALAVWKALHFEPSSEVIEKLETIVFNSWNRPCNEIPTFA
jgi:hypothetical protein